MNGASPENAQLGFDAVLRSADAENRARKFERETAHLPGTMADAVPLCRALIRRHHAAMLGANVDETFRLRKEVDLLAWRLNDGNPGILANEDAPGYVLLRETAALTGAVPLWGQCGEFVITLEGVHVRIELDGILGIASHVSFWPGFSAHVVDADRPFISKTGYRSFLGIRADPRPGIAPDAFTAQVIAAYITRELKGRLVRVNS